MLSAGSLFSYKPCGSVGSACLSLMDPRGELSPFLIPFLSNFTSLGSWESSGTWLKLFAPQEGCPCKVCVCLCLLQRSQGDHGALVTDGGAEVQHHPPVGTTGSRAPLQRSCCLVKALWGRLTWEDDLTCEIHPFSCASPRTNTKSSAIISPADVSCCSKTRIMDNWPLGPGL